MRHSIYDTDPHFVIDPITRVMTSESQKISLQQFDHNSERFTFEVPRFYEGHDLSLCDQVTVHYINVEAKTKKESADVYLVDDLQLSPHGDDVVICSWLISRNAAQYAGTLAFLLKFRCLDGDKVIYEWNTAPYKNITISEGINNGEQLEEDYSDILAQWETEIADLEAQGKALSEEVGTIKEEVGTIKEEVNTLTEEVEASKPKYTKDDIDPVFAFNSWDLIKWVCQHDDPSKYWRVGDYKEIVMVHKPIRFVDTTAGGERVVKSIDEDYFLSFFNNEPGVYVIYASENVEVDDMAGTSIAYTSYNVGYPDGRHVMYKDIFNDAIGTNYGEYTLTIEILSESVEKTVPVQIIGFNHDTVADKTAYGKGKAGMTLMLGCNRTNYGNQIAVYDGNIPFLSVSSEDNHIVSPNRVDKDGSLTEVGTNWPNGGFKDYLALHFDKVLPEEIRNGIVPVIKITSCSFNAKNYYRDIYDTKERYFLLSEYELYGEQLCTKSADGEQYEFFKEGHSKILITPELYDAIQNGTSGYTNSRLWLRSVASKYVDKYIPSTNYFNPLNGYTENPEYVGDVSVYTNGLLMSYNGTSGTFNYYTGPAKNNGSVSAYIAPCFCL